MMYAIFARLTIFFMLPLATFAVGASLLGRTQPVHPALRGFTEGCADISQPCWYGIVPGQTLLSEALSQIEGLGLETWRDEDDSNPNRIYFRTDTCIFSLEAESPETPIFSIQVNHCENLRVGDLITELGTPTLMVRGDCVAPSVYLRFAFISVTTAFGYNKPLSLQAQIDDFYIVASDSNTTVLWQIKQPYHRSRSLPITAPRRCSG